VYEFFLTDSLEKVFADSRPRPIQDHTVFSLQGGKIAFQLAYFVASSSDIDRMQQFKVTINGAPSTVRIRTVELVPSQLPALAERDSAYLRTEPGLFPDLLTPCDGLIRPIPGQWRSLFIDFTVDQNAAGPYTITLSVVPVEHQVLGNGQSMDMKPWLSSSHEQLSLFVINASIPKQKLLVTQWFHADCLANYYMVNVFCEQYWNIVESFIWFAAKEAGINMLLTPIFTPPLDTEIGQTRTTVQLVQIEKKGDRYFFTWDHLRRWCAICKKAGITHLEMAHLFTQWGALYTPKIVAKVEGREEDLFGWHVKATDPDYRAFLQAFIPELLIVLEEEGYEKNFLRFHISDEPNLEQLESYLKAKQQVEDLLDGCVIMDALSDFEFYKTGIVQHPVCANDHIGPFLEHKVPNLWIYYCVAQNKDVPNRFFSMPSSRNRIMGVLMYLYQIEGFLHWGYNFYNSQYSKKPINPFLVTDCDLAFPSGDAFIVYPGEDGSVLSSLRNEIQKEGFEDMQCLSMLESLTSRSFVFSLLHEDLSYTITFDHYPMDAVYLLKMRKRCLEEIHMRL
jgi:hypothetical protein